MLGLLQERVNCTGFGNGKKKKRATEKPPLMGDNYNVIDRIFTCTSKSRWCSLYSPNSTTNTAFWL